MMRPSCVVGLLLLVFLSCVVDAEPDIPPTPSMDAVWKEVLRTRDRLHSLAATVVQPLRERLAASSNHVQELKEENAGTDCLNEK